MKYLYVDGDNIGLRIEQSFLNNDEDSLIQVNNQVGRVVTEICDYLVRNGHEIIFNGADGIISKGVEIAAPKLIDFIRQLDVELTFSLGIGCSLMDSYIALRYAKSKSKNIGIEYSNNQFTVIEGEKTTREKSV